MNKLTESYKLSESLGVTHKYLIGLIDEYKHLFLKISSLSMISFDGPAYALNQGQVDFCISLCKNTPKAIEQKTLFVKRFLAAKETYRLLQDDDSK